MSELAGQYEQPGNPTEIRRVPDLRLVTAEEPLIPTNAAQDVEREERVAAARADVEAYFEQANIIRSIN